MPVIVAPKSPDAKILYETFTAVRPVPALLFAVLAAFVQPDGKTLVTEVVVELYPLSNKIAKDPTCQVLGTTIVLVVEVLEPLN
jgi:hypothetical protein